MKIKKKSAVKASEELIVAEPVVAEPVVVETLAEELPAPGEELAQSCCKYQCAIDFISDAIECLAEIAKDDEVAKDSIANLGVVMLDLKGAQ